MEAITLTPHGTIIFPGQPGDWREIIFDMAARQDKDGDQVVRFWRRVAESFIFSLCRLPENQPLTAPRRPSDHLLRTWVEGAPPMRGGEYLSETLILAIWEKLTEWVLIRAGGAGGLANFLAQRAPKWQTVGRVAFHLAENKVNPNLPFAFMATYVTGLTEAGGERHLPLFQALRQYAGERDQLTLARLLTPVQRASESLPWVEKMVSDNSIYQPTAMTITQAHQFLVDVPKLEDCGLMVRIPNWWKRRSQVQVRVVVGEQKAPMFGLASLLDWKVGLSMGDENLSESEIQELLDTKERLVFFKGQWLEADRDKLKQALSMWSQARARSGEGVSFIEAMRLLVGYPSEANQLPEKPDEEINQWVRVEAGQALEGLLKEIRRPQAMEVPKELNAVLRPYQEKGLAWLALLSGLGLGACLADDMGLGKTIQVLALLLLDKKRNPEKLPSLLVAPASLLSNWRLEASRFAPDLRLSIFHPSETPKDKLAFWERRPNFLLEGSDLVVTSYALLARKLDFFAEPTWRMMIIDEAQAVKNPATAQSRAVRKIKAHARLALTGTPIENRLLDIWSLFDFLSPGLLGSARKFKATVSELENRTEDQYGPIRRLVAPYLLRRLKTDKSVISDLPDKTETTVHCWLSQTQAKLYGKIVDRLKQSLMGFSQDNADQFRRKGLVLQSLMQLKQLCNHPAQLTGDLDWSPERSGKFLRIAELTREMSERQDKVLVFTQFQEIIEPLGHWLTEIFGRPGLALHGGTPVRQRQGLVSEFQKDDGPPFFILSLKAGGTGLNLTAAGHVIHFDRWWNPAVEDQATDRAYRIGQKKNVLVHKCVTRGTVEERVDLMLTDKRRLANEILGQEGEINIVNLDDQALLDLIRLDIDRAVI